MDAAGNKGGFDIISVNPPTGDIKFDVASDHVIVRGKVTGFEYIKPLKWYYEPASLEATASVYLKTGKLEGYDDTLFITGRSV